MKSNKNLSFTMHAVIYMGGRLLARSISIILLPIYTAYIVPSEYGILSILGITMNFIMLILSFQLPSAIYRYWHLAESAHEKERVVSSAFIFTLVVSITLIAPLYLNAERIASALNLGTSSLFKIVLFQMLLAILWEVFLADMRVREESTIYAATEIGQNIFVAILSIFTVVYLGMGIKGMIISQFAVFFLLIIFYSPRFYKRNGIVINFKVIKDLLRFSTPLIPAAVAMAAVHNIDQYFLQKMLGPDATGTYAIGYKFGMLVNMLVVGPFLLIWQPRSFEIAKSSDAETVYGQIFTHLFVAVSFFAVVLTGMSNEIVHIMTASAYHHASNFIPWIAWAYVLFSLSFVANIGLLVKKRTPILSAIVLVVFIFNLIGNYYCIKKIGAIGAAISTVASFTIYLFLNLIVSQRYIAIKYEYIRLLKALALDFVAFCAMKSIDLHSIYVTLVFKVIILLSHLLIIAFGFYSDKIRFFYNNFMTVYKARYQE